MAAGPTGDRTSNALQLLAVCAPGLEPVLAGEIRALGFEGVAVIGGVEVRGSLGTAERLNLWLRSCSRVLLRLGAVRATSFPELVRKAGELPFELCLRKGAPVSLRVTCRKSRLYHSGAVAERLHRAMEERLGGELPFLKEASGGEQAQLIVARFDRDVCTVSADTSGAHLHRRGYRTAISKAPLRETLAAGLLLAAGYTGVEPLLDPLCGAGTIPIEAALIARRRAPGLGRTFALQRWPSHEPTRWRKLLDDARAQESPRAPASITASDADAAAIAAARANAGRAVVESDISFAVQTLSELVAPAPGLLATNPPYGVRLGAAADLEGLYRTLGDVARSRLRGWHLVALVPDARLARATGLSWQRLLRVDNGGLRVDLLLARP